jgi:Tfp pilus assembly protein PilV
MNRRKFVTTTALVLPSVAVLGAISTQPKTYRSATSLYSNEDMTEWCNKNGMFYAKDNELNKKFFNSIIIIF